MEAIGTIHIIVTIFLFLTVCLLLILLYFSLKEKETNGNELKQKIYTIVLDKIIIGVFLLIMTFFINNALEKSKSYQSFSAKINITRVEKVGEVWEKLYDYEYKNSNLYENILTKDVSNKSAEDINKYFDDYTKDYKKTYDEVITLLNNNRFWIGEEPYKQFLEYCNIIKQAQSKRISLITDGLIKIVTKPPGIATKIFKYLKGETVNNLSKESKAILDNLKIELNDRRNSIIKVRDDFFSE